MVADREALIGSLAVGDIFHAEYPNGASCICLVLSVSDTEIKSRRITTQEILDFDRKTGREKDSNAQSLAAIDSITPLPAEIHDVFLGMDKKFKAIMDLDEKSRSELDAEQRKLTGDEKKALIFVGSHYASNLLPPPVSSVPT
jgi:hypothetical protein